MPLKDDIRAALRRQGETGQPWTSSAVTLEAMGVPDPVRLQFREALNEAIGRVVRDRQTCEEAIAAISLPDEQVDVFRSLLTAELRTLDLHNCARYRLTLRQVEQWLAAGRPQ